MHQICLISGLYVFLFIETSYPSCPLSQNLLPIYTITGLLLEGNMATKIAPPSTKYCIISFPSPGILLVLINRPRSLNALNIEASYELDAVFRWFDEEPSCRVAVLSGVGKAFCTGADLKGVSVCVHFFHCLCRLYHNIIALRFLFSYHRDWQARALDITVYELGLRFEQRKPVAFPRSTFHRGMSFKSNTPSLQNGWPTTNLASA